MNSKDRILEYLLLKGISKREFYLTTGLSNGFLDKTNNIGADKMEIIISKYRDINLRYIVSGEGDILGDEKMVSKLVPNMVSNSKKYPEEHEYPLPSSTAEPNPNKKIPLIPIEAIAGWGEGEMSVTDMDIQQYVIPEFNGTDFLIRVKGSSMYPSYNSGDIVACKYVKESRFIQWGKVYVLDSSQGALVKRLFKSEDKECIECRSDNTSYPPFDIPKEEIRATALVVGVIRLE